MIITLCVNDLWRKDRDYIYQLQMYMMQNLVVSADISYFLSSNCSECAPLNFEMSSEQMVWATRKQEVSSAFGDINTMFKVLMSTHGDWASEF